MARRAFAPSRPKVDGTTAIKTCSSSAPPGHEAVELRLRIKRRRQAQDLIGLLVLPDFALEPLKLLTLVRGQSFSFSRIAFALANPAPQRLRHAPDLRRHRYDGGSTWFVTLHLVANQSDCPPSQLLRKPNSIAHELSSHGI